MKKIIKQVLILACLLTILVLPYFVFAKTTPIEGLQNVQENSGFVRADENTVARIAGTIVASVLTLLGVIFIILIIYAGFLWMTDHGNAEQVEKAKKILRNSIIGLIILLSAYAIYAVVENIMENTIEESPGAGEGTPIYDDGIGNDDIG